MALNSSAERQEWIPAPSDGRGHRRRLGDRWATNVGTRSDARRGGSGPRMPFLSPIAFETGVGT